MAQCAPRRFSGKDVGNFVVVWGFLQEYFEWTAETSRADESKSRFWLFVVIIAFLLNFFRRWMFRVSCRRTHHPTILCRSAFSGSVGGLLDNFRPSCAYRQYKRTDVSFVWQLCEYRHTSTAYEAFWKPFSSLSITTLGTFQRLEGSKFGSKALVRDMEIDDIGTS